MPKNKHYKNFLDDLIAIRLIPIIPKEFEEEAELADESSLPNRQKDRWEVLNHKQCLRSANYSRAHATFKEIFRIFLFEDADSLNRKKPSSCIIM